MDDFIRRCCEATAAQGFRGTAAAMILLCMVDTGADYRKALQYVAEYRGIAAELLHSDLCYDHIKAVETPLPMWELFEKMRREVNG